MKFKHFFWDFDGTLFDTYPRINRAIQKALHDTGRDVPMDTVARLTKVSIPHLYDALHIPPEEQAQLRARYHEHFGAEGYDTMAPYAGAQRLLESICAGGGHNYLYTLRDVSALDALKHFDLDKYFCDFVTSENGFPGKPAPDALLYLMEKHGLSPDACIMLGDRDIDLGSGQNAGMACALFDPDHYYDHLDTPLRYTRLFDLMAELVWEDKAENLSTSDMLALQEMLQEKHPEWGGNTPQQAAGQLLWLVGELGEAIDVVKKTPISHLMEPCEARARLVEELADVAMYFHDVLQCYGISAKEFSQAFYGKMRRNLRRDYAGENKQRYGK